MSCQIVLFNKAREQVGFIRFDSETRAISLDWNQNYSQELSSAVTSLLKSIQENKSLKARREITIENAENKTIRVQKIENVSVTDPNFLAALADKINRSAEFKSKLFAVVKKI